MERTFEAALVEQCAPTLAGLKPASLFRWGQGEFRETVAHWAKALAPFGIGLRVLKTCPRTGDGLIYLYRAAWLRQVLTVPEHQAFLEAAGYRLDQGCAGLLEQLSQRLCLERQFPHEIGVFLGYPLEDVVGFIENQGRHYTYCGYWKAYGDPAEAQCRFDRYRRCTELCKARFLAGTPVTALVAA